jgi:hypothetical protein
MSQKVANKYNCKYCDYNCYKNCDYNKHILTAKHKKNENRTILNDIERKKSQKSQKVAIYICDCGKEYNVRNSLWYHKKKCSVLNNIVVCLETEARPSILDLISQNKELMNLLITKNHQTDELIQHNKELHKTIQDIVPKIGNNTTNNNQFNLQVFLNEDCKDALNFSEFLEQIQISFEDLENQAENGYIKGISRLFIESLQELGINKRPIHCSDKKRKTIYIKEDNEWDKEGSLETLKKGINEVTRRTLQTLMKEKVTNAEEYKDGDSEFSMKCINIQRNLFPSAPREATIGKVIENITQNSGIV